jgi:hypothetical protein
MMPALIKGQGKQKARQAAEAILVRVGLKNRLNHMVGKLSGANNNGLPSQGLWFSNRWFFWRMSLPVILTGKTAIRFTICSWD